MGNLQTNEVKHGTKTGKSPGKVKALMKIRGKRGKADPVQFTGVVPEGAEEPALDESLVILDRPDTTKSASTPRKPNANTSDNLLVTDSWCKVNQSHISKTAATPPSAISSSSDSNFTDPLTPVGFNAEVNQCYYSEESVNLDGVEVPNSTHENFMLNLTLNSFKLNDYRARHEEEKTKKLSKLGVSKTSQISLDNDPRDCFSTDNVEIINKNDEDREEEDYGTLKKNKSRSSREDDKDEAQIFKGTSDLNQSSGQPEYKRHMSVPTPTESAKPIPDSLVLKKVASLTLNSAEFQSRITKPRFVPEKLDFQLYEKFEGHMLVNWYLSEFNEDHHLLQLLNGQDLKLLAIQFCTHLLAAGVLRQIPDKDVPMYNIFKPDCMYYWTHAETPLSVPQTPGRLSMVSWPPMSPSEVFITASTNDAISTSSPKSPPEFMPLVTQHEEKSYKSQEFRSSARDVEILSLEEEINRLKQEVEKYKTYIEIQNLTANAVKDFSSPLEETKPFIQTNCDTSTHKTVQTDDTISYSSDILKANYNSEAQSVGTQTDEAQEKDYLESVHLTDLNRAIRDDSTTTSFLSNEASKASPSDPLAHLKDEAYLGSLPHSNTISDNVPIPPPLPPPVADSIVPPPPPLPLSTQSPPPPPMPIFGGGCGPPPPPMPTSGGGGGPPPPPPPLPIPGSCGPPPPPPIPGSIVPPPPPIPGSAGPPPPPIPGGGPPPPPPPGGPVPLPAPPVGGWSSQKAGLRKISVSPAVPMKPLYWTRILAPAQIDDNLESPSSALWTQIDELPLEGLSEFTDLFSRQVIARKPTVKKLEQKAKVGAVKLLDSKRSQNVGILAQSLHIEFQEIENAIYNFDTSIVSLEILQQIYEARATQDELDLIKNHLSMQPKIPLDKPEQFLYELSEISNFAERISCLMLQVEFDDSISTIDHTLTNIKSTCEYLVNSPELKEVFAIILTLGNYMNGGNMSRGQADGFGLEILPKLKDVKSKDSKITLLHFIVRMYMKKVENPFEPNVTLPVPEPGDIRRAASVNFDDVKVDLQKLEKQLQICERRTQMVIESSTIDNLQPFKDKMTSFLENSKRQLATEWENLEECKTKFINTMKFYLFKPKTGTVETYPPNSFFEFWLPFCNDFKDIFKKELIKMEKEKIEEIRKKETERLSENVKIKERENGLKSKIKKIQAKQAKKIENT